jgi:hypothetical protein
MKFTLVYQDHLTKFVILLSLHSKRADKVAYHLLEIFTILGALNILHSDNGREFCNQIIKSLCEMWNDIKIVHGKPRHSESQDSVQRANQDVENMLATWMETNNTTKWSEELRFVQAKPNRAYHERTKCLPYEAMFGVPMKLGIANSALPRNVTVNMTTEEDLEKVININNECTGDIEDEDMKILSTGVGKCQHLRNGFVQARNGSVYKFFGILPPHCGKCQDVPVKPRIYQFRAFTVTYMWFIQTRLCVCVRARVRVRVCVCVF